MLALKQIMEEKDKKAKGDKGNFFFSNIPTYKIEDKYQIKEPPIFEENLVGKQYDLRLDIIDKILNGRTEDNMKIFRVCFKKRPSGYRPQDAELSIDEIKKWAPVTLVDFYESKLHTFSRNDGNDSHSDMMDEENNFASDPVGASSDDEEEKSD